LSTFATSVQPVAGFVRVTAALERVVTTVRAAFQAAAFGRLKIEPAPRLLVGVCFTAAGHGVHEYSKYVLPGLILKYHYHLSLL
jgi:hypothetical protein